MPELPEVEVITRELKERLIGETIADVEILWPKTFINKSTLRPAGRNIRSIGRHGKFIIFDLDRGSLFTHLRMTGKYIYSVEEKERTKHLRVIFRFKSGRYLYFYDARKFGRIFFTENPEEILANFGIDAMDTAFTAERLFLFFKNRKRKVKPFLLDQKYICGLGNIYIDESLFKSGIHPETPCLKLSESRVIRLHANIMDTLNTAIRNMGTTLADYRTTGGGFGSNQHFLQVYGRSGEPCIRCKSLIDKIVSGGRGTHYCPKCQPLNGALK